MKGKEAAVSTPVAELVSVSHRYGKVAALSGVTLALGAGQVPALLGPNGAGKTTAVSLLTGLLRPTRGEARLFGIDPRSMPARRRMGVMLQGSRVPETLTVREHLHQGSSTCSTCRPRSRADCGCRTRCCRARSRRSRRSCRSITSAGSRSRLSAFSRIGVQLVGR
jgi:ABC-type branched-subunit amino acid transport system ATPase component